MGIKPRKSAKTVLTFGMPKHGLNGFLRKNFIEVWLIYNVVPTSALQKSDSVIHIEVFFFGILFLYGLSF